MHGRKEKPSDASANVPRVIKFSICANHRREEDVKINTARFDSQRLFFHVSFAEMLAGGDWGVAP